MEKELSDLIYCPCGAGFRLNKSVDGYGVNGNLYICPICKGVSYIDTHALLGNSYVRYFPFTATIDDFKKVCLDYLLQRVDTKFFKLISEVKINRYYIPIREFGSGDSRFTIPLCSNEYTAGLLSDKEMCTRYDALFFGFDGKNLTTELFANERNKTSDAVAQSFLPITVSNEMLRFEYDIEPQKYYVINYWPIFVMSFKYNDKEYYIKQFGTLPAGGLASNFNNDVHLTPDAYRAYLMRKAETKISKTNTSVLLAFIAAVILGLSTLIEGKEPVWFIPIQCIIVFLVCVIFYFLISAFLSKALNEFVTCSKKLIYLLKSSRYTHTYEQTQAEITKQGMKVLSAVQ